MFESKYLRRNEVVTITMEQLMQINDKRRRKYSLTKNEIIDQKGPID